jgi:uncharacterized membrane protein YcjF (UPF0283 family)
MSTDDSDAIKDPETRRLLYEHLKDAPERQLADTNDLDGKAATLFGAASIIMGLASFGNLGTSSTGAIACAITALLVCAVVAYAATAVAALVHLRPVEHRRTTYAQTLQSDFRDKPPAELQEWLIRQARRAWEFNDKVGKRKARTLAWIVAGLGAEVVFVVAALIVSRF